jgi:hypothetical protein
MPSRRYLEDGASAVSPAPVEREKLLILLRGHGGPSRMTEGRGIRCGDRIETLVSPGRTASLRRHGPPGPGRRWWCAESVQVQTGSPLTTGSRTAPRHENLLCCPCDGAGAVWTGCAPQARTVATVREVLGLPEDGYR